MASDIEIAQQAKLDRMENLLKITVAATRRIVAVLADLVRRALPLPDGDMIYAIYYPATATILL